MNTTNAKRFAVAAVVAAATSGGVSIAAAAIPHSTPRKAPHSTSGPAFPKNWTPNDCIRLNSGDWNACNVGNSGRGDLPYRPVPNK